MPLLLTAHQDVVDQRLIGPGVVEGRGHVDVSIHQDEQRPLKTAQEEKDNQTLRSDDPTENRPGGPGGITSALRSAGTISCVLI